MKPTILFFLCLALFKPVQGKEVPRIEQGIFHPTPPFENIKTTFYVRERERPFLAAINDASTSIAIFLVDVIGATSPQAKLGIRSVLAESRDRLRLPPIASFDKSHRYAASNIYCWGSDKKDQISFFINWGDITSNARYTDSYIFIKRGDYWYFDRHGSPAARKWLQTERYFQLTCPSSGSSEY